MCSTRILVTIFASSLLALVSYAASNQASAGTQQPLTAIPTTPGGIIEYGAVAEASTLPAAMGSVLRQIHQACGERPVVGQVFRVKGSSSVGVFFTVVAHAQGDRQMAGLVIGAQGGYNRMEAAVVADSANRFGQTANGMLRQLFAAWNPGGSARILSRIRRRETGGFNKSAGGSRGCGAGLIGAPAPGNGGGRLGRDIGS